jgi:hypothetical protein
MKSWDSAKKEYVETPEKLKNFFDEIESVCKKYDYSISHEDKHGAFGIEEYDERNIEWLRDAHLWLKKENK